MTKAWWIALASCVGASDPGGAAEPPDADADTDGDTDADADGDSDTDSDSDTDTEPTVVDRWLHTDGNGILRADGTEWQGRGANLHDTRSCNACTWGPPDVEEVKRRIDVLVDDWGADFVRLTLESYGSGDGRVHWQGVLDDPAYLADVVAIVDHIGAKDDVYVLLSLWIDPSFDDLGWPTGATGDRWDLLARTFADDPHVMFGLVNEPQYNFDGSLDADVWQAMNTTVQRIRDAEAAVGARPHLVSVQGTGGWARLLDYYTTHPILAGGGADVIYETHVYDPASAFATLFEGPKAVLPVIIGEYGEEDASELMARADALEVPYLAWTFHPRCPPNLLVDNTGGGCGEGMALEPTAWGEVVRAHLRSR